MLPERYKDAVRATLQDPEAYASTLFLVLVDLWGSLEFINWDPENLQQQIYDDLHLKFRDLPGANQDKIMMAIGVHGTDLFYNSLEWFIHACNAFSGVPIVPAIFDPATIEEAAWAVTEVAMLGVDEGKELGDLFNDEIKAYLGAQGGEEGLSRLPAVLDWATPPKRAADQDPAGLGAEMFAASFQTDQENVANIEGQVKLKSQELGRQLAAFPFRNRET